MPLFRGHLVERRIPGDAGIRHDDLDRTVIGLDLGDPGLGRFVIGDVPLVGGDAGLLGEGGGGLVIAGIVGGDLVAGILQGDGNRRANPARAAGDQSNSRHDSSSDLSP